MEDRGELWAAAVALLDVLEGQAERITIEPPGDRGNAIDFELVRAGVREYHVVRCWKREAHWRESTSLSEICAAGIPHLIRTKLAAGVDQFNLVLQPSCAVLSTWVHAVADDEDAADFWDFCTARMAESTSKCNRADLMQALGCDTEADCFAMLKRLRVDALWPDSLRVEATTRAALFTRAEEDLLAELLACALAAPGRALSSANLAEHLRRQGIPRRASGTDAELAAAIEAANRQFLASHRRAFLREPDPADRRVEEIANLLKEPPDSQEFVEPPYDKCVKVTGRPGTGKSSLIVRLVEELSSRQIPCLALRLDWLEPGLDTRAAGRQMGMPHSPAATLALVAQGRDCVLVLDEMDSARRASNGSPRNPTVLTLRQEARMFPNMRFLVVDDGASPSWPSRIYAVGALPGDTARRAVGDGGFDANALTEGQMILLSVPLHLSMLSVTAAGSGKTPLPYHNVTQLFDAFWEKKQQECAGLGLSAERCQKMVGRLCEEIDRRGTLFVPEAALQDCRADAEILTHAGVLLFVEGKWGFFHDAFFDFANAHRHMEGQPVAKYLRQTMRLQRDCDFPHYCRDLESLLNSTEAPDSAKTAAIDFLNRLEDPTAEEWKIVMHVVDSTAGKICGDALKIFVSNDRWFELATESGAVDRWNARWTDVDSLYSFLISHYYSRKGFSGRTAQEATRAADRLSLRDLGLYGVEFGTHHLDVKQRNNHRA